MTTIDRSFLRVKREFCPSNRRDSISKREEKIVARRSWRRGRIAEWDREEGFFSWMTMFLSAESSATCTFLPLSSAFLSRTRRQLCETVRKKRQRDFYVFFFFSLSPFFFFFFPFSQREEDREEGATNAARFLINFLIFDIWYLIILEWNEIRDSYCG